MLIALPAAVRLVPPLLMHTFASIANCCPPDFMRASLAQVRVTWEPADVERYVAEALENGAHTIVAAGQTRMALRKG